MFLTARCCFLQSIVVPGVHSHGIRHGLLHLLHVFGIHGETVVH